MVAKAIVTEKEAATEQQAQEKLRSLLPKEVIEVFDKSFKEFAKVQIHAGLKLLAHEDVVVESPTGSGKTLAFLLPALTIMKRKPKWEPNEIGLLVICPSRDLALQIAHVGQPFADALGYSLHATIGGKKIETDLKKIHAGVNILIATPGRLERLIDGDLREGKLKRMLRCVEILIVDEADKFTEVSFAASMNTILPCLPKQRRTGLFSATQAKDKVDLAPFTLRSPAYIKLADEKDVISPSSLSAFYTIIKADEKLCALVEFIRSVPDKKVLVFFASCQCVQYFSMILPRILSKRKIFAVHGKNKKSRFSQMTSFRKAESAVMLSTDLMSRGIDIHDLDWVVHFDIPKKSSWFVHRCGRAGRNGREGSSLLLAIPGQTAYVNFIKQHEHLEMKEMKLKTVTELKAEQLRQKVVGFASKSREILEHGTSAYVSWLKASTTNDAHIVCKFKELDIIGHAHSFGLLRLPKCKETYERDVSGFKRSEVDTSTIQYENKSLEDKRKEIRAKNEKRKDIYKEKEANDPRAQLKKKIKEKREGKNKKNKGEKKSNEKKKMELDEKENGEDEKVEIGEKRKIKTEKKDKTKKRKVDSTDAE
ncbi:hypothetical protein PMAYCL1PPCAC_12490 [Pristionchus mayeri]|uniref:ATP-dependent RNA helicase n=1 Tax=Pristionchus mayeri TaxID=1317129 RepID=A0AAN4ZR79_9BILA|nr:hypothetical protein PMAYCL1PPCAC_12490 [Pristionchus mayeri]